MSKAFTREDDLGDDPLPPLRSPLPPGVNNYITPAGAEKLQRHLADLQDRRSTERNPDAQRQIDARLRQLTEIVTSLVISPVPADHDTVRFGATVTFVRDGREKDTCRIVGVDETDLDRDQISWLSPLAKALLTRRVGDRITFRSPAGVQHLEIVSIKYE